MSIDTFSLSFSCFHLLPPDDLRVEVEVLVREGNLGLVEGNLSLYELWLENGERLDHRHGFQLREWDGDGLEFQVGLENGDLQRKENIRENGTLCIQS